MTIQLLDPNSPAEALTNRAGGKATQLAVLGRLGCSVPSWFCIPVEGFDAAFAQAQEQLDGTADTVPSGVSSLPVPNKVKELLPEALAQYDLSDAFVAVRSSGLDEDGTEHSFAGQFESYLYRQGPKAIAEAIGRCWASAFSERNVAYRKAIGKPDSVPRMGVVIQRMIASESAGVAFSRNPLAPGDRDTLIVESVWGQGEGIVSGKLDSDHFVVNRNTGEYDVTVANKVGKIVARPEGGIHQVTLDDVQAGEISLTSDQVRDIAELVLRLETELGVPQDLEWAIANGQLFSLQTRPITTLPPDAVFDGNITGSDAIIWDNSNIVESYAGVTTPLTFSHVNHAYREVYIQTCGLLGVPQSVIEEHEGMFRNMLGLIRGRIYYNLLNWYRLLSLFPLLGKSGSFMETMMGVKQSLEADLQPLFDTVVDEAPQYGRFKQLRMMMRLAVHMLGGARANELFLARVDRVCRPMEKADLANLSLPRQVELYHQLHNEVLKHWKAPIVNDTRCMIAFGMLKSLTEKWIGGDGAEGAASLQNDLLCGSGDLKSTEPMRLLLAIATEIDGDADIRKRLLKETPEEFWGALQNGFAPDLKTSFESYITEYGYRCVDELKLETLDYHDRPHMVVASVQGYVRHGVPPAEEIEKRKQEIRGGAEAIIRERLRGVRRAYYFAILRWTRRAVSDRELLRFERTRTFGVVRQIFRGVGQNMEALGALDARDDVFYLTIEEIIAFTDGRATTLDLSKLTTARQHEYEEYRSSVAPPNRFLTRGAAGAVLRHPSLLQSLDLLKDLGSDDPNVLHGTSCCPGVVEGPVRVAYSFEDTEGLDGEILVTERTDPGWVPAFPACSGLIIERGSLLSHSAVVARELGIPTVVGVEGDPLKKLQNGQRVRLDAGKGEVRIL
jgi:phosphohistidine swiveling domain-containing protein